MTKRTTLNKINHFSLPVFKESKLTYIYMPWFTRLKWKFLISEFKVRLKSLFSGKRPWRRKGNVNPPFLLNVLSSPFNLSWESASAVPENYWWKYKIHKSQM